MKAEDFGFKLHHVGVAVPAIGTAADLLQFLLGYRTVSGPFDDPLQKVSVSFLAQSKEDVAEIELVAPLTEDSPVSAILGKSNGAAYHLCFETSDLDGALQFASSNDCVIVSRPTPAVAFGGRRIAWIYTPGRMLIELVEAESIAR